MAFFLCLERWGFLFCICAFVFLLLNSLLQINWSLKMSVSKDTVSFPMACVGNPELLFHSAEAEDIEELSEFVISQLFHQFPMKNTSGFDVEENIRPWMTRYISHMWPKNYSIIIRDTNNHNKIIAAAFSDIGCKNHSGDIGLCSFCDPVKRLGWE